MNLWNSDEQKRQLNEVEYPPATLSGGPPQPLPDDCKEVVEEIKAVCGTFVEFCAEGKLWQSALNRLCLTDVRAEKGTDFKKVFATALQRKVTQLRGEAAR